MADTDARTLPLDETSGSALAANGLEYRLIDHTGDGFPAYIRAMRRGFLDDEPEDDGVEAARESLAYRRFTGVFDAGGPTPGTPVGTIDSWVTPLTVPGGAQVPMWAISGVTVAATHRRKGIARAMLEGELRTAAAAGLPLAGLTVSEATIYGRFGFSPAAFATDWTIETARARWIGPHPAGRLDYLERDDIPGVLARVHDAVRAERPGEVEGWDGLWRRFAGTEPGREGARKRRAVTYTDEAGATRGVVVYTITAGEDDYSKSVLGVHLLLAETPDAYAALWRFVLEHDLIATVKTHLMAVDEPLRWMIADQRGAKVETFDHEWLRILDVPATLAARTYAAPGTFALAVSDPLGFAEGTWGVTIDGEGRAHVVRTEETADAALDVGALGSLLLGGVRATTLAAAGRITAAAHVLAGIDTAFATSRAPHLGIWY